MFFYTLFVIKLIKVKSMKNKIIYIFISIITIVILTSGIKYLFITRINIDDITIEINSNYDFNSKKGKLRNKDIELTNSIIYTGNIIGIKVVDHIIISPFKRAFRASFKNAKKTADFRLPLLRIVFIKIHIPTAYLAPLP